MVLHSTHFVLAHKSTVPVLCAQSISELAILTMVFS